MSIHSGHRQRLKDRFRREGLDNFDELYVLELLLYYCIPRRNTNEIAHHLIERFGSISAIFNASQKEIENVFYISQKSSSFISALGELKNRIEKENRKMNHKFPTDRNKVDENIGKFIGRISQRGVYVIFIDNKGRKILARRIRNIDRRFGKDVAFQKDTFGIQISGAYVVDYSSAVADIPSLVELEKVKYIENSLNAVEISLYDYYLTDGKSVLSIKRKNTFFAKKECAVKKSNQQ
jgi:DNA repair protein RadC